MHELKKRRARRQSGQSLDSECEQDQQELHKVVRLMQRSFPPCKEVQNILSNHQIFRELFAELGGLTPALMQSLSLRLVPEGRAVFQRGQTHNVFYFVLKGEAVAMVRLRGLLDSEPQSPPQRPPGLSRAASSDIVLQGLSPGCHFRQGSFFGQGQLFKSERKVSTVIALTSCWLLGLKKEDMEQRLPPRLNSLKNSWKQRLIRAINVFHSWESELESLLYLLQEKELPRGQVAFAEGDLADCLYLLKEGEIQLSCTIRSVRHSYMRISSPSFFGEENLFQSHKETRKRTSTASVLSAKAQLFVLSRRKLGMLFERPDCPYKIKQVAAQRGQVKQRLIDSLNTPAEQEAERQFPIAYPSPQKRRQESQVEQMQFSMLMADSKQYYETRKKYRARLNQMEPKSSKRARSGQASLTFLRQLAKRVFERQEQVTNTPGQGARGLTDESDREAYEWCHRKTRDLMWSGSCRPRTSSYSYQQKRRYFKYIQSALDQLSVRSSRKEG